MKFSLSIESIPGEIIVLWSDQTILTAKKELYTILNTMQLSQPLYDLWEVFPYPVYCNGGNYKTGIEMDPIHYLVQPL